MRYLSEAVLTVARVSRFVALYMISWAYRKVRSLLEASHGNLWVLSKRD
jgi:hypothetical protein